MINPIVSTAIREFLQAGVAWSACPLVWEGEQHDEPDPPSPWALLRLTGSSEQASIGAPGENLWRDYGRLMIDVFVPQNAGADPAQSLLHALCLLFRERQLVGDALMFEDVLDGGTKEATAEFPWLRASASIAWQFDN